jgi:hypothetical protein
MVGTTVALPTQTVNTWLQLSVPLSAFGVGATTGDLDGFVISATSSASFTAYFDDISLLPPPPVPAGGAESTAAFAALLLAVGTATIRLRRRHDARAAN